MVRLTLVLTMTALAVTTTLAQSVPVPRPFPGAGAPPSGTSTPRTPPAAPPPAPTPAPPVETTPQPIATPAPPAAASGPEIPGVPLYPTAEFLDTIDAGSGQQYYLYGTHAPYRDIVNYYRTVLRNSGREIYRSPGVYQFDLGRFNESRMAYPPSVVVKDYAESNPSGFLFVSGTTETRFQTIIQIVPAEAP